MKKTIPITIAGQLFYIEEDAFDRLNAYLNTVKTHFSGQPGSEEIISDIESRVAERFLEGNKSSEKIVTLVQVDALIASMGNVEDFDDEQPAHNPVPALGSLKTKKLFRNTDDAIVAGVCSGIAAYFAIDPLIVRILWVASLFVGGGGVLAYIIFWVLMPEAKTATEKLQMRGQPVTLESVNEMVKEKVDEVKKRGTFRKIILFPVVVVTAIIRGLSPVLRGLVGGIITLAAGSGILFLIFAALNVLFNSHSPYVDFPARDFVTTGQYYTGLTTFFFALFVPCILLLLLGLSIALKRSYFAKSATLTLIGIWVLALLAGGTLLLHVLPEVRTKAQADPRFHVTQNILELKDFSKVNAQGATVVHMVYGPEFSVQESGTQFGLDSLDVSVTNGTLTVKNKHLDRTMICVFCSWSRPEVTVTMPQLTDFTASGSSAITATGFTLPALSATIEGASSATINGDIQNLTIHESGASSMEASGTGDSLTLQQSGASRASLERFSTATASITSSGASQAHVWATRSLMVNASGASRIYYQAAPVITKELSGASKLMNEETPQSFPQQENDYPTSPEPVMPIIPQQ